MLWAAYVIRRHRHTPDFLLEANVDGICLFSPRISGRQILSVRHMFVLIYIACFFVPLGYMKRVYDRSDVSSISLRHVCSITCQLLCIRGCFSLLLCGAPISYMVLEGGGSGSAGGYWVFDELFGWGFLRFAHLGKKCRPFVQKVLHANVPMLVNI